MQPLEDRRNDWLGRVSDPQPENLGSLIRIEKGICSSGNLGKQVTGRQLIVVLIDSSHIESDLG